MRSSTRSTRRVGQGQVKVKVKERLLPTEAAKDCVSTPLEFTVLLFWVFYVTTLRIFWLRMFTIQNNLISFFCNCACTLNETDTKTKIFITNNHFQLNSDKIFLWSLLILNVKQQIGLSKNPSVSDIAFAFVLAQCKQTLNARIGTSPFIVARMSSIGDVSAISMATINETAMNQTTNATAYLNATKHDADNVTSAPAATTTHPLDDLDLTVIKTSELFLGRM